MTTRIPHKNPRDIHAAKNGHTNYVDSAEKIPRVIFTRGNPSAKHMTVFG